TKDDFIAGMIPTYSKYLIDLVIRICNAPDTSLIISRYFNLYPYKVMLLNELIDINNLIDGLPIKNVSMIKLDTERRILVYKKDKEIKEYELDDLKIKEMRIEPEAS
ncbi:MAG: hypothetical protein ACFFDN_26620, partial [Candidatus Hodarchaeota archaeon]